MSCCCTAQAPPPEASLRFDAGEYSLLHATQIKPDALPGGASCTLRRYTADIPAGAQTAQLKLSLSGNSCKVYDYALVMLIKTPRPEGLTFAGRALIL